MEAGSQLRRLSFGRRFLLASITGLLAMIAASPLSAADIRTKNFLIHASTSELAHAVGKAAEGYRRDLAVYWLGGELRPWASPCPIRVISGPNLAAQGVTTYNRAPVRDFQMEVVGTPERILDSVLPHEVTHTILATHFGRPLPRWADEGICTTVEHESERSKHEAKLREFLQSKRGIAMNQLFLLTEYPNDVLPMYAQGYSVCRFLINQKDPRTFIRFLHDYMQRPSWTANIKKHYGYDSLRELQEYWLAWVAAGSGPVEKFAKATPGNSSAPRGSSIATGSLALASLGPASPALAEAGSGTISQALGLQPVAGSQPRAGSESMGTALASAVNEGWYQRQRQAAKSRVDSSGVGAANMAVSGGKSASGAIRPMVPPSIRNSGRYSVSQPQREQRVSRGDLLPNAGPIRR